MNIIDTEKVPIFMFTEQAEEGAIKQAKDVANHPCVRHYVSVMPDTHQGYGMPIGGVCALEDAISPNMVGVDIGCGMLSIKTNINLQGIEPEELQQMLISIMRGVRKTVPMGFQHRSKELENPTLACFFRKKINAMDMQYLEKVSGYLKTENIIKETLMQIGTLGGGNHFIELQKDSNNDLYIMLHSGSRNIGKQVCDIFNKRALSFCQKYYSPIPNKDLAFLPTDTGEGRAYIDMMDYCQCFAEYNRQLMGDAVLNEVNKQFASIKIVSSINVHHNYAALEHFHNRDFWIHRKGAICAREGMLGAIPGSMGTSSYIVKGKGNHRSWNSCSHGAGRTMSRKRAKETFTIDEFKDKMSGIVFHCDTEHLDESPMAYKDIKYVMEQQVDLVDIITELKPLAVEKA